MATVGALLWKSKYEIAYIENTQVSYKSTLKILLTYSTLVNVGLFLVLVPPLYYI